MATDRDAALRKAEKLLRQGRLDQAIAEYMRIVDEQPHDLTAANMLGDLYVRAGQVERAAAQYARIASHLAREGFLPKAAALYKKILKVNPGDEDALLQAADIAARQGLVADARSYLTIVARRREARGDARGAAEVRVRLGEIDPGDVEASLAAARASASLGGGVAVARLRTLADDLLAKGRQDEALAVLGEAVRLAPADTGSRRALVMLLLERGDWSGAAAALPDEQAAAPELRLLALETDLRTGRRDRAASALRRLIDDDADAVVELGWRLAGEHPAAGFQCVEPVVDRAVDRQDWDGALASLNGFVDRTPHDVGALLKLVEVCVDAGRENELISAQIRLVDAYLEAGSGNEARVIAEDLVVRSPEDASHLARLRRALALVGEPDPDRALAERLRGASALTADDLDFDLSDLARREIVAEAVPDGDSGAFEPQQASPSPAAESPRPPAGERAAHPDRVEAPRGGAAVIGPAEPHPDVFELSAGAIDVTSFLSDVEFAGEEDGSPAGGFGHRRSRPERGTRRTGGRHDARSGRSRYPGRPRRRLPGIAGGRRAGAGIPHGAGPVPAGGRLRGRRPGRRSDRPPRAGLPIAASAVRSGRPAGAAAGASRAAGPRDRLVRAGGAGTSALGGCRSGAAL